jgi:glucokinase
VSVVAADIGATHSRFVLQAGVDRLERRYENACFSDLYQVIAEFLGESDESATPIDSMVLGLPAPVNGKTFKLTNIDWQVDVDRLQQLFPVRRLSLVNDFQAAAVGALNDDQSRRLNPEVPAGKKGPAVVTGAGTGLGLAWFGDVSVSQMPWATEGGHADFAPQDPQQYDLHAWLAGRHGGHVSLERLLSGPGLVAIYQYLGGERVAAAEVKALAEGGDALGVEAVQLFVRIFGAYVGNLALLFNPRAGIHLCGGVVAHLAAWFDQSFLDAVADKGRMRPNVESIPLFLHDRGDIGLQGALQIAMQELR